MASVKLATLVIRTIAKPISNHLKSQAKQHDRFREFCVGLAQRLYRSEVKLRTNIMGEPAKHIRPLSEARAVENGANALAEGFLFAVAAGLIIGESWRSSRSETRRRSDVDDKLDSLGTQVTELSTRMNYLTERWEDELRHERQRNDELARILQRIVDIGLNHGGWADLGDTPLQNLRIQHTPPDSRDTSPPDTRISTSDTQNGLPDSDPDSPS
ncbi:putative OPA3-domain-containing protein [Lyophyllum shimeji]|uniref:OPA3-domain-containing protein n=1 Tax=Lyophyllum shimeji TaxID=47721 RepID=A0A9P3PHS3_LYOSH|nr:putative OPA3-domain-containing protein [Lyophyllum shimeji]